MSRDIHKFNLGLQPQLQHDSSAQLSEPTEPSLVLVNDSKDLVLYSTSTVPKLQHLHLDHLTVPNRGGIYKVFLLTFVLVNRADFSQGFTIS